MPDRTVFDRTHYLKSIEARGNFIRELLPKLDAALGFRTAADAGCGLGFFAEMLAEYGLTVQGFDGRRENVDEAKKRCARARITCGNIEDLKIAELGTFDFVLCFGLLYHLENPLLAIRNLQRLTGKCLLLESMCLPDAKPYMLLREEPSSEDQSLTDVAFYASEGSLIKMLFRAGYSHVYRTAFLPDHDDFKDTAHHIRRRTVLCASRVPIAIPELIPVSETHDQSDPWAKRTARFRRVSSFLRKPWHEKVRSLSYRWTRAVPFLPVPVRLPSGAVWLAENDFMGTALFHGGFENTERFFVERLVKPGMTVLDIGAHHGYYTLLAAQKVGPTGKVLAVEASPRERKRLKLHLKLNRVRNVQIESRALGESEGTAQLYLVRGTETGCNSLRKPSVDDRIEPVAVAVDTLDHVLEEQGIGRVDFIKLDVEGAELSVLRGSEKLLLTQPRPVFLAEVQDIRTQPWGYPAREIIRHMHRLNYCWFSLLPDGGLDHLDVNAEKYDGNFVAVPKERLELIKEFLVALDGPEVARPQPQLQQVTC